MRSKRRRCLTQERERRRLNARDSIRTCELCRVYSLDIDRASRRNIRSGQSGIDGGNPCLEIASNTKYSGS